VTLYWKISYFIIFQKGLLATQFSGLCSNFELSGCWEVPKTQNFILLQSVPT